jgi:hypothetical protein
MRKALRSRAFDEEPLRFSVQVRRMARMALVLIIRLMETSFSGPPIDDNAILERLPAEISAFLRRQNGLIAAHGCLHVRGACIAPAWHSIRSAWEGEFALHHLYPGALLSSVPLAEDCFGDQYLLRDGLVIRLVGETGDIEPMECDWPEFLANVEADPVEYLHLGFLDRFREQSGPLAPCHLIHAYPPFVTVEGRNPSLRAIPALELRSFHADFARQIRDIPDGTKMEVKIV